MPNPKPKSTPKYGGLWDTNKTAFVDSVHRANQNLDFVRRLTEKGAPSIQVKGEPGRSTHLMSNDHTRSYPTVVRKAGQKGLTNLGNTDAAYDYADQKGEFINFKHPEQADWYSSNGYKKGTGVLNNITPKGVPFNDPNYQIPKYEEGAKSIKVMKSKIKMKQKAARGLQDVAVPEAGSGFNVLSSAASGAATGASVGGVYGAVIGGIAGAGMGVGQMISQDKANAAAIEKNKEAKRNRAFDGIEVSVDQKGQAYKKGTIKMKRSKIVEAEHKEHVFDDQMNHKGVVLGKTHKEGGEDIKVDQGDSIFPAKHKETIDKALQKGDIKKINQIKKKLPKDTKNGKAALGLNGEDPDQLDESAYKKRDTSIRQPFTFNGRPQYADDANRKGKYNYQSDIVEGNNGDTRWLKQGQKGNPNPYAVSQVVKTGTMYRDDNMPQLKMKSSLTPDTTPAFTPPTNLKADAPITPLSTGSSVGDASNEQSPVGNIGKYANLANNVFQSLKPQPKVEQSYLDPELLKYQDTSESLRKQSRQAETVVGSNARNTSGGMASNIRANQQAASIDNLDRQDQINEREVAKANQIDNTNVGIKNSAKQINLGRKDMYQDIMDRNRAASESYMGAAAKEITDQSNINEQTNYLKSRDAKLDAVDQQRLNIANKETMYTIDANGNKVFNNNPNGGPLSSSGTTKSVTTKEGADGKTSSSTTVKTASEKAGRIGRTASSIYGRIKTKRTH